jgi:beta-phosphoglucomutase-like phosphatase (HAD superfamily)
MTPKVVFFGAIGTLVETSQMQRQAFNKAFAQAGLGWHWSSAEYRKLLTITDGVRRIEHYAALKGLSVDAPGLHDVKSRIFKNLLADGVRLRLGVDGVIAAARANGAALGFVPHTECDEAEAVLAGTGAALSPADFDVVAGPEVAAKAKPAPDIYIRALDQLGMRADDAVAIEDTPVTAMAAVRAGIRTVGFQGAYAEGVFDASVEVTDYLTPDMVGLAQPSLRLAC